MPLIAALIVTGMVVVAWCICASVQFLTKRIKPRQYLAALVAIFFVGPSIYRGILMTMTSVKCVQSIAAQAPQSVLNIVPSWSPEDCVAYLTPMDTYLMFLVPLVCFALATAAIISFYSFSFGWFQKKQVASAENGSQVEAAAETP